MKTTTFYTYLGSNGTITSHVYLDGIYHVKKYMLTADEGKQLTKDNKTFFKSVFVNENELEDWKEVVGQN